MESTWRSPLAALAVGLLLLSGCRLVWQPQGQSSVASSVASGPASGLEGSWRDASVETDPPVATGVSLGALLRLPPTEGGTSPETERHIQFRVRGDTLIATRGTEGAVPRRYRLIPDRETGGFLAERIGRDPDPLPGDPLLGYRRTSIRLGRDAAGRLRVERREMAIGLVFAILPVYTRDAAVSWFARLEVPGR